MSSSHIVRLAYLVAVALLFGLSAAAASLQAAEDDVSPNLYAGAPRNIAQACRTELPEKCNGRGMDRIECLTENYNAIGTGMCRQWIVARALCVSHVKRDRGSQCFGALSVDSVNFRRCIREANKDTLPAACRESDYYRSLFRHMPRDFMTD